MSNLKMSSVPFISRQAGDWVVSGNIHTTRSHFGSSECVTPVQTGQCSGGISCQPVCATPDICWHPPANLCLFDKNVSSDLPSECPNHVHVEQLCWPPLRGQMWIIWTHLQTTAWVFAPSEAKNNWQTEGVRAKHYYRKSHLYVWIITYFNKGKHSVMCSETSMSIFKV